MRAYAVQLHDRNGQTSAGALLMRLAWACTRLTKTWECFQFSHVRGFAPLQIDSSSATFGVLTRLAPGAEAALSRSNE